MHNIKITFKNKNENWSIILSELVFIHYYDFVRIPISNIKIEDYIKEISISLEEYRTYNGEHILYDFIRNLEDSENCPQFILDENPIDIEVILEHING